MPMVLSYFPFFSSFFSIILYKVVQCNASRATALHNKSRTLMDYTPQVQLRLGFKTKQLLFAWYFNYSSKRGNFWGLLKNCLGIWKSSKLHAYFWGCNSQKTCYCRVITVIALFRTKYRKRNADAYSVITAWRTRVFALYWMTEGDGG